MPQLLQGIDPPLVFLLILPLAAVIAAWALRVSCNMCDVDAPDFWHCLLAVVIVVLSNLALHFALSIHENPLSYEARFLAPLAVTVLVLGMSIRTGPINACKVILVQGILCGILYYAAVLMKKSLMVASVCGLPVKVR